VSELRIPNSPIPREFATIIHGAVVIAVLPLIAVAMIAPGLLEYPAGAVRC
jgi:hypothetical protein